MLNKIGENEERSELHKMVLFTRVSLKKLKFFEGGLSDEIKKRLDIEQNLVVLEAIQDNTACGVMVVEFDEDEVANIIHLQVSENSAEKGLAVDCSNFFIKWLKKMCGKFAVILQPKIKKVLCSSFLYHNLTRW